jgi:hypothetical protein
MSDYAVKFTDTNKTPITVSDDTETNGGLDIQLFGRGFLEYGEELDETLLHLLENFACPEDSSNAGNPNIGVATGVLLSNPTQGQLWYNSSRKRFYQWDGTQWNMLASNRDYAANWGQVSHGTQLPPPIAADGYEFPYSECIWIVSPGGFAGRFNYYYCSTDNVATAQMQYHLIGNDNVLTDGFVNYLIIGIRGGTNADGDYTQTVQPFVPVVPSPTPTITPTVTPAIGASPTPTVSVTPPNTPTPTPTFTPSPTRVASPTPTHSITPTPTHSHTPTPTMTPTPSPITPLDVTVFDSANGGDVGSMLSVCYLEDFTSVRDHGYESCDASFITCSAGQCAPKPGTYVIDGTGAELGVTVSGGIAPYTVSLQNVVNTDATYPPAGECVYFAGYPLYGWGTTIDYTGSHTVFSGVISSSGGSITGLDIKASCGSSSYSITGHFDVYVTDASGQHFTQTISFNVLRASSR